MGLQGVGMGTVWGRVRTQATAALGTTQWDAVEPCEKSFVVFPNPTDLRPTGTWLLLLAAPLMWGFLWWALAQALWWGRWAFRAWGWAQSGVA